MPGESPAGLKTPDVTKGQVGAIVATVVGAATAFGAPISNEQQVALLGITGLVSGVWVWADAHIRGKRAEHIAPLVMGAAAPPPRPEPEPEPEPKPQPEPEPPEPEPEPELDARQTLTTANTNLTWSPPLAESTVPAEDTVPEDGDRKGISRGDKVMLAAVVVLAVVHASTRRKRVTVTWG